MSKIKKPRRAEIPGAELRKLMDKYRLYGNDGAKIVAGWLNVKPDTIQHYLHRGLRRNDFELAQIKAAIWDLKGKVVTYQEFLKAICPDVPPGFDIKIRNKKPGD